MSLRHLLVVVFLLVASVASAQTVSITGRVADPQGAVVSAAVVTAMHNASPTDAQRTAIARSPLSIDLVTVDRMRRALQVMSRSFVPKELDVLQFQGEPYFMASRPPGPNSFEEGIGSNDERSQSEPRPEHLIVSALEPERGAFRRFSDDSMWAIAKAAMPGIPARDASWLMEYDAYYYDQYGNRPLPVLRVR